MFNYSILKPNSFSFLCLQIPKADTTDYILEPAKEIDTDDREESIIFCIDISGSMCVTTEISGSLKLKGDKSQSYRHLNNENMDQ